MEKKTPLYDLHIKLGGRIVPFGGYLLPVQYESGIMKEHMAVRTAAGIFDVSHMGEFIVAGTDSTAFLQNLLTNDFSSMKCGTVKYSLMCYEHGGTVDDLLVYKLADSEYILVVNASNREKDLKWIENKSAQYDIKINDISDSLALIAMQGPLASEILKNLISDADIPEKNYTFKNKININGVQALISRTGYTGEDGFEFYINSEDALKLYNMILAINSPSGLIPCGLGARDTLRLEAGMTLYGHELSESIDPITAGLGFFVKMEKRDFIGREALTAIQKAEKRQKRIGLEAVDKGILREGCDLFADITSIEKIGFTTSGTLCPYINKAVAMALVPDDFTPDILYADVRGRRIKVKITELPFYKRKK